MSNLETPANTGDGTITEGMLAQQVEKVSSLLDAACRHVADGRNVDLAPLESKVQQMCAAIHAADHETRRGLKAPMETILSKLERLEGGLERQYAAAKDNDAGGLRQHARDAYRKAPGTGG